MAKLNYVELPVQDVASSKAFFAAGTAMLKAQLAAAKIRNRRSSS